MQFADYHLHTKYSFDSQESIDDICLAAINKGLREIAITDHWECNYEDEFYDIQEAYNEILLAREKYKDHLIIRMGVELGQATQNEEAAQKALEFDKLDVVLGSLHNVKGMEDFYLLDYTAVDYMELMSRYFDELYELVVWGKFDVLAHLDYPARYIAKAGIDFSLDQYKEKIDRILLRLVKDKKGLEINTSGLRADLKRTMPGFEVLKRFISLGGEYITFGSDAHKSENIGDFIAQTIKATGIHKIATYEARSVSLMAVSS